MNKLLLPLAFLLVACRTEKTILPEFGKLSPFELIDQTGTPFSSRTLAGQPWILDFFYTSCSSACPRMSAQMEKIQAATGKLRRVPLVSITVDPARDTPPALATYAARYHAQPGRWRFVTGGADLIRRLQKDASVEMDPEDPSHSQTVFLVDGEGYLRGMYTSDGQPEIDRLLKDLADLLANPQRPKPGTPDEEID